MMRPPHICIGKVAVPLPANLTLESITALPTAIPEGWLENVNASMGYGTPTPSHPNLKTSGGDFLVPIIVHTIVLILATVGNSMVISTLLMNKRMGTVTNYFLLSLAVSDLMMAILCIPVNMIGTLKREFILGAPVCKAVAYLMGLSVAVSTFTMVAISLERYYAICRPLQARGWQTKSHACKVIIGVWVFSFLLMLPAVIYNKIVLKPIAQIGICKNACRIYFPDQGPEHRIAETSLSHKAWYIFQFIALLCIPGIIMTVAYGCICKTIYNRFRFNSMNAQPREMSVTPRPERRNESQSLVKSTNAKRADNGVSDKLSTQDPLSRIHADNTSARASPSLKSKNGIKSILKSRSQCNRTNDQYCDEPRKTETRKQLEAKKKVVEMLIVIVVLFFVCWTPTFIANVWKSFNPLAAQSSLRGTPQLIFGLLRYISACVNPVVYCFLNKRFRDAFLNIFCVCCGCLPARWRPKTAKASRQAATQNMMLTTNTYAASTSHM